MGKGKKQKAVWQVFLRGGLITVGIYLAGVLLLALLITKGVLPERAAFPVTALLCVAASLCGGLSVARGAPWGTLPAAMTNAAIFVLIQILVGLSCWQSITWTGRGGILLLCALGGAVLAGLLGGKKRQRRKRPL